MHAVHDQAAITDSQGVMFIVDVKTRSIVWRHSDNCKLKHAFFPDPEDNTLIFGVSESSVEAFKLGVVKGAVQLAAVGHVDLSSQVKVSASSNRTLLLTQENSLQVLSIRNK
jgi:hypothetical protein